MQQDQHLDTQESTNPLGAFLNARDRSDDALDARPDFFDVAHMARVDAVKAIVNKFFKAKQGVYVNHRLNRNKPFSVVKVAHPDFPRVSFSEKDRVYRNPLLALGCEIKTTNTGVVIRVK